MGFPLRILGAGGGRTHSYFKLAKSETVYFLRQSFQMFFFKKSRSIQNVLLWHHARHSFQTFLLKKTRSIQNILLQHHVIIRVLRGVFDHEIGILRPFSQPVQVSDEPWRQCCNIWRIKCRLILHPNRDLDITWMSKSEKQLRF